MHGKKCNQFGHSKWNWWIQYRSNESLRLGIFVKSHGGSGKLLCVHGNVRSEGIQTYRRKNAAAAEGHHNPLWGNFGESLRMQFHRLCKVQVDFHFFQVDFGILIFRLSQRLVNSMSQCSLTSQNCQNHKTLPITRNVWMRNRFFIRWVL